MTREQHRRHAVPETPADPDPDPDPEPDPGTGPATPGAADAAAEEAPLFSWRFAADPYPTYAALREQRPVYRATLPSGVDAWLVTRYAEGRQALADARLSKDPSRHSEQAHRSGRVGIPGERSADLVSHLLNIDPPDHTRLRRLVSKAFTPRRVAAFEPRVRQLTEQLIDGFSGRGEADLIHAFAFPLPIYAVCDLLGVPAEDQDDFRDWAGMMIRHGGGPRGGVAKAVKRIRRYLAELIHRKRAQLATRAEADEDLISGLIRASDHGEQLTENEVAAMAFILLFAGFETTVNLIGNGLYTLLRHPEQRTRLQEAVAADDSSAERFLNGAVEELLRYDGPVEMATWRFATEPVELGGARIEKGEPVLVVLAATDRDPDLFAHPDALNLTRSDNPHLGFGHGVHYCLGAPLARLEGRVALGTLLSRLPDLQLDAAPEELRWRGGLIMRGLRTLPVRFEPDVSPSP